eukprot:TRINITY_DN10434_c3_g1_i1.p1 TRINITY_DN10434_c3_g1~~TRINITY_DN10434_c3_g1_i1.p1  ORF type:complete len:369 (+),score=70.15 TRINITY_DN10434_c3_g1_i1:42-1148(+)
MKSTAALLISALLTKGAEGCSSNMNCSLNGVCQTDKTCRCNAGWTGDDCGSLNLHGGVRMWPSAEEGSNVSSWGISKVTDAKGITHTLVDVACGQSGVFHNDSFVAHLTSNSSAPDASLQKVKQMFSVPFSFGPHMWTHGDLVHAMFRVNTIPTNWKVPVCPGNTSRSYPGLYDEQNVIKPPQIEPMPSSGGQPNMWVATTRDMEDWDVKPVHISGRDGIHVSNPSVTFSKTLQRHVMAFRWNGGQEHVGVAISDSASNYTHYTYTETLDCGGCEDPFIYEDAQKNFHILWHAGPHGGHSYSMNATSGYVTSSTLPFTLNVTYANGEKEEFLRRERPALHFENGVPKNFYSAVYDKKGFCYSLSQDLS